jgi:hypothetical protein
MDTSIFALRQAFNGTQELSPSIEIVDRLCESLIKEHAQAVDSDLKVVALVREAIWTGVRLANARVGDLV